METLIPTTLLLGGAVVGWILGIAVLVPIAQLVKGGPFLRHRSLNPWPMDRFHRYVYRITPPSEPGHDVFSDYFFRQKAAVKWAKSIGGGVVIDLRTGETIWWGP